MEIEKCLSNREKFIIWWKEQSKIEMLIFILSIIIVMVFGFTIYVDVGMFLGLSLWVFITDYYSEEKTRNKYLFAIFLFLVAVYKLERYFY